LLFRTRGGFETRPYPMPIYGVTRLAPSISSRSGDVIFLYACHVRMNG